MRPYTQATSSTNEILSLQVAMKVIHQLQVNLQFVPSWRTLSSISSDLPTLPCTLLAIKILEGKNSRRMQHMQVSRNSPSGKSLRILLDDGGFQVSEVLRAGIMEFVRGEVWLSISMCCVAGATGRDSFFLSATFQLCV